MPVSPGYNERAWAIDVIVEINLYLTTHRLAIVSAGGENSLNGGLSTLFPDVLLYGAGTVLQGWELKMPDVPTTDSDLLRNAADKARRLGASSFLVWNGTEAVLYQRSVATPANFHSVRSWGEPRLTSRRDMQFHRALWQHLLEQILDDLNEFFGTGALAVPSLEVTLGETLITDLVAKLYPADALELSSACVADADFDAQVNGWWIINSVEHDDADKCSALAQVNIIYWINRLLFGHYLKHFNRVALRIDEIRRGISPGEALEILSDISLECDFMNVFCPSVGDDIMSELGWRGRLEFNELLSGVRVETLPQDVFRHVLDKALIIARRKLAGQYSTPPALAQLLSLLTINDRNLPVLDPCCGTGTIAKAAYDLKRSVGVSTQQALETVWASDKFQVPLQMTSIVLSDPEAMGEVVQVFRSDVFDLDDVNAVTFINPARGGERVQRALPRFHAIVSNLPFVRFEDSAKLNPNQWSRLEQLSIVLGGPAVLNGKADLYANIIPCLYDLLADGGWAGVVVSNSWLGTDWGVAFRALLQRLFRIRWVLISGAGRWFANSAVVTTVLILQRRNSPAESPAIDEQTDFVVTQKPLGDWTCDYVAGINQSLRREETRPNLVTWQRHSQASIAARESYGFCWSALFVDTDWLTRLGPHMVPVSSLFKIARGERRGWDPMFFPPQGSGIEHEYLQPVLISTKHTHALVAQPDGFAFCCSRSEDDLYALGHVRALAWIDRFRHQTNEKGVLLPTALQRSGQYWYEMKPETRAIMAISMNPDEVLSFLRFRTPTFVNQRLIRLTAIDNTAPDVELMHALLNSIVEMFLIAAAGFGRGLGVLDLNATRLSRSMHMLDPDAIGASQRAAILSAFDALLQRAPLPLLQELEQSDRKEFDSLVLSAFGLEAIHDQLEVSLRTLFAIRKAARTG